MDELVPENTSTFSRCTDYIFENKLKMIAFVVSSFGAFCVASLDYGVQALGFEMWIFSNLAWIFVGVQESDYPLILTFFVYFLLNIVGSMNRWGW